MGSDCEFNWHLKALRLTQIVWQGVSVITFQNFTFTVTVLRSLMATSCRWDRILRQVITGSPMMGIWRRRRLLHTRIMALFSCALHAPNSCAPGGSECTSGRRAQLLETTWRPDWALHVATHVAAFAASVVHPIARAGPFFSILYSLLCSIRIDLTSTCCAVAEHGMCYLS